MPGPFELTTFGDGTPKRVDWKTRAALEEAQALLGYPLTVVQGSYNHGGVSASAGTHDGGGVVDLLAWDWQRKVKALRKVGFAAWYRPPVRGLWGPHIHAVLIDHGKLAPVAARQVTAYRNGRDGLRSNLPDRFWRPSPIPVFHYPPAAATGGHSPRPPAPRPATAPAAGAYPPKRTLDGVDTSHHQGGRIDLKAARAAGLRWWYLKATEGDSVTDATYKKRVKQARDAGIPVGAYHFARPDPGDAAKEARFFLEHADIRAGDMLPMLDLESLEGMSLAQVTTWTGRWVHTVDAGACRRRGLVAKPIIYTPFSLGSGFGCLLWVARYSDDFRAPVIPKPWRSAAIWQHSNGQVRAGQARARVRPGRRQRGAPRHPAVGTAGQEGPHGRRLPGSATGDRAVAPGRVVAASGGLARAGGLPRSPWRRTRSVPDPVDLPESPVVLRHPVVVPVVADPVDVPGSSPGRSTCRTRTGPVDRAGDPRPSAPPPTEADVNLLIDLAVARVQLELAQQQLKAALARLPER